MFLLFLSIGVGNALSQPSHPQSEQLPESERIANVGGNAIGEEVRKKLARYETRLGSAKEIASIGEEEGEAHEIIGEVTSTIVHDGKLFILDSKFNEVKIYSIEGDYIDSFGKPGPGPGELASPVDFGMDEEGRIWVADVDRSISVFAPSDSGYVDVNTFTIDVGPEGLCVASGSSYIYGPAPSQDGEGEKVYTVHQYTAEGEHLRSFGQGYRSETSVISMSLSRAAAVECIDNQRQFIEYRFLPASVLMDLESGKNQWLARYQDQKTFDIQETTRNGSPEARFKAPEEGAELGSSAAEFGEVVVVTKFEHRENADGIFNKYLIDTTSGAGIKVGTSAGEWDHFASGLGVKKFSRPYPRVSIYRLGD